MKKKITIFLIICLSIIIIELISMYIISLKRDSKVTYIDTLNSIHYYDNYYIASGSSNFHNSKYNNMITYEYDDNGKTIKVYKEQAKLVKYDNELNVIFEKTFKSDYDSMFYDSIVSNEFIYAVGNYVYDQSQISLKTRDGLLVKYDLEGNFIWSKNFQILGNTTFKKIIDVDDGVIVIGQSIYENMEIGNHDTGGGIIIKYDYDGNIIWKNNFGGNKSGILNDIISVSDGYIACGRDALNYGMLIKFSKDGKRLFVKNYEYTDTIGMSSLKLKDNKIYIAGAYNNSKDATYQYDACIFVYDLDGNLLDKYVIGGNKEDHFNNLILLDKSIIAIGYTMSSDILLNNLDYNNKMSEGMIVEFDYNGKILNNTSYSGSKNETLNDIIKMNDKYLIIGYSNSKRSLFKGNNKDYFGRIILYNKDLTIDLEK